MAHNIGLRRNKITLKVAGNSSHQGEQTHIGGTIPRLQVHQGLSTASGLRYVQVPLLVQLFHYMLIFLYVGTARTL
jgi:hypothetical protein